MDRLSSLAKQPRPSSTSSPRKISTQPHKDPTIVGYVHNVSPVKASAKGTEYFSFTIQEKEKKIKALCFTPRKHKSNVESKAENGTSSKLTKFSVHPTEENVIWVNAAKQINDALEPKVDFSCDTHYNETPVVTTKDLDHIQVYQSITVCGMVLWFFLEKTKHSLSQQKLILSKEKDPLLTKLETFQSQFGTSTSKVHN